LKNNLISAQRDRDRWRRGPDYYYRDRRPYRPL